MQIRQLLFAATATLGGVRSAPVEQEVLRGAEDEGTPLPLVIWHGLGDNYQAEGLRSVGALAESVNPGTYVYYVHLDDDASRDKTATFLGNVNDQVAKVCDDLAADPILSTAPAINGLGFSQGSQFLRAYVERCNKPPVSTLVTYGGQHNGIAEFQDCSPNDWLCNGWEGLLKTQTWADYVQKKLVPAQYFRNPEDIESYLEYSNFLADINNERPKKNQTYVENMKKLDRLALYIFGNDTTVVPKWSGWFWEYNATSEKKTVLQDRQMYREDWLGLKYLFENKRLDMEELPGRHMQLDDQQLADAFRSYFSKRVDVTGKEVKNWGSSIDL